jgi:hypothetical protein
MGLKNLHASEVPAAHQALWAPFSHYLKSWKSFYFTSHMTLKMTRTEQNNNKIKDTTTFQEETAQIEVDPQGNIQAKWNTSSQNLTLVLFRDELWVSYGYGPMRYKSAHDMDTLALIMQSIRAAATHMVLLGHSVAPQQPKSTHYMNRPAAQIAYLFKQHEAQTEPNPSPKKGWPIPYPPAPAIPGWLSSKHVVAASATLEFDKVYHLLLSSHIKAHFIVQKPNTPGLKIWLESRSHVSQLGRVKPLQRPKHFIHEYQRTQIPDTNDLLEDYLHENKTNDD